jgi:hypothetical protein
MTLTRVTNAQLKDVITPEQYGAKGDGTTDDNAALTASLGSNSPILFSEGDYSTSIIFVADNGRKLYGEGPRSKLKALAGFPATMDMPFASGAGTSTTPAALLQRPQTSGESNRMGMSDLAIDANSQAPVGVYWGIAADIQIDNVQITGSTGAGFITDGPQNTSFSNITVKDGTRVRILNGTYNCNFLSLDITDTTDGFIEIGADSTYPSYQYFSASDGPRNVTFRNCIWERAEGTPTVMVDIKSDTRSIALEDVEVTFTGGTGSPNSLTSLVKVSDSFRSRFRDCIFTGGDVTKTFPHTFSVFTFEGSSTAGESIVEGCQFVNFNPGGNTINAMFSHSGNGDLHIKRLKFTSNSNFSKLIESSSPTQVYYEPWKKAGVWSDRPTEWIEANCTYFDTDTGIQVEKVPGDFKALTLAANAAASATSITVSSGSGIVGSDEIDETGDQICITLDDGRYHVTTVSSRSGAVLTIADAMPSLATSGNAVAVAGRWKTGRGLNYFGSISYADGDTTPAVCGVEFLAVTNSGATTITNFEHGTVGQTLRIQAKDGNTTINNGANIITTTGAAKAMSSGDVFTFVLRDDFKWKEI